MVPSLVGFENVDTATATVNGYSFAVETRDAVTGEWSMLAQRGDPAFRLDVRPNAYPGATYPASGAVAGTTAAPGAWATWGLQGVLDLTPAQVSRLLDPARTSGIRTRTDVDLAPSGVQARRLYTYGSDFIDALREQSGDVTEADGTLVLPSGEAAHVTASDEAGLGRIAPGQSVTVHRTWDVPVPAARRSTETDAGYLNRLLALDGTSLDAASFIVADGGVGRLVAPLVRASSTRHVPVVGVSTTGPEQVPAGSSADYAVHLANLGSTHASDVDTKASAGDAPLPLAGAPTSLAGGERAEATATYAVPTSATGPVAVRAATAWKDALGSTYGETGSSLDVQRLAPASLRASFSDTLQVDVGGDSVVSPGDTVRYTLTVRNGGGVALRGVTATVPVDANSGLVPGSGRTPDGGTVTLSGGTATVSLPDIAGGGVRTVTFDVTVTDPFPSGVSRLSAQGTAAATGIDEQQTDDPALPGADDATRTTVTVPKPALAAYLTGRLAVDADGSGDVSPGDTLAYRMAVSSVGTQDVTGIHATVRPPNGTSLVPGSVTSTQGNVGGGTDVSVALGTLAPFQECTVDFRLRIASPLPAGVSTVSVSGSVTSDNLDAVTTDDPSTYEVGDSTSVPIGDPRQDPEKPGPVVGDTSPLDGTVVTAPTTISTSLTPPDGDTLASWRITAKRVGTDAELELSRGPASPVAPSASPSLLAVATPPTEASAAFDPTVLPNGIYQIRVIATSSNGGKTTSASSVVVGGQLKLGRYTTSVADHQVGLGGLPLQVVRSYDSFDKARGDFGTGWNLDIADFRVATAAPLGLKGWTAQAGGCGLVFCNIRYTSTTPHFVTVVWPDGHQEMFDLKPTEGSTFFPGLSSARFEPRAGTGTTSPLEVADDDSLFFRNDGNANGGAFGSGGVFDPTQFRLTDKNGIEYLIDRAKGLQKVTDLNGNTLTVTPDGVTSSYGKGITYVRDAQGRITKVTSPAGETGYEYDTAGDLTSVTALDGQVTTYTYDEHRLVSTTGAGGTVLGSVEYGPDGRVSALLDGAGNRTRVDSSVGDRQETVHDAAGRLTTVSSYDDYGNQLRQDQSFDGQTLTTRWTYDAENRPVTRTDPAGHISRTAYDASGSPISMTDAEGRTWRVSYNDFAQPVESKTPSGAVERSWTYDDRGRLTKQVETDGPTYELTYAGDQIGEVRRNGAVTGTFGYDAQGRLATSRDPASSRVSTYSYDAAGHVVGVDDGAGPPTTMAYDDAGRLVSVTDRRGGQKSWSTTATGCLPPRSTR